MHHEARVHTTDSGIKEILKKNDLSVTAGRKKILELFLKQQGALSHSEIEKRTGDKFDRVTIYRTLQAFTEKRDHTRNTHRRQFHYLRIVQERLRTRSPPR